MVDHNILMSWLGLWSILSHCHVEVKSWLQEGELAVLQTAVSKSGCWKEAHGDNTLNTTLMVHKQ